MEEDREKYSECGSIKKKANLLVENQANKCIRCWEELVMTFKAMNYMMKVQC